MKETKEYLIIPLINGLYRVFNKNTDDEYEVDIHKPKCSCKRFKYTRKNKAGIKKLCKHISYCRGLKNKK